MQDMNCDASMFGTALLAVAGIAIGNSTGLRMRRTWLASPNLWSVLIAPSGSMKTPALGISLGLIRRIEAKLTKRNREAWKNYEDEVRRYKALPPKKRAEADQPRPPVTLRILLNDATVEALQRVHAQNPRGLLLFCDEFCVIGDGMGRYSNAASAVEGIYLSMHSNRLINVDRNDPNKPAISIDRAGVSIVGGTQPEKFKDTMSVNRVDNGFLPRILLAMPDVQPKQWNEETLTQETLAAAETVIEKLFNLSLSFDEDGCVKPVEIRLGRDAKARWKEWYDSFNRRSHELGGRRGSADSKLEGYVPRIALIIHMVKVVSGIDPVRSKTGIGLDTLEDAIKIVEWHRYEGQRVYAMLGIDDAEKSGQDSLVKLIINRFDGVVTPDELARNLSRYRKNSKKAKAELDKLCKAGIGEWRKRPTTSRGGRPTREFVVSSARPASEDSGGFEGSEVLRPTNSRKPRIKRKSAWASVWKKYKAKSDWPD